MMNSRDIKTAMKGAEDWELLERLRVKGNLASLQPKLCARQLGPLRVTDSLKADLSATMMNKFHDTVTDIHRKSVNLAHVSFLRNAWQTNMTICKRTLKLALLAQRKHDNNMACDSCTATDHSEKVALS